MRKLIRGLIYQKWFYGFLAAVLWFDCWTDIEGISDAYSPRALLSVILSTTSAILITLIFVDLHFRWPPGGR